MLNKKIGKLIEIVESIDFEHNILLKNIETDNKFTVFLAGKSGSGKTMLLNSLLNLDDEFYISSKVSTLTQFRISSGDRFEYSFSNSNYQEFSDDIEERRQRMRELNNSNKTVYVHNSDSILKNINIIDVPGFFDFRNKNEFLNELLIESDLVLFLKSYYEMITPEEKQFLNSLTENNIQYCVLFTKTDITNRAEGLNKKNIPDFVKNRSKSYEGYLKYFLVSAKNNQDSISELKKYLMSNYLKISNNSMTSKLERVKKQYIVSINVYIQTLLNKINVEVEHEKDVFDKNQIEIQIKSMEQKEIFEILFTDNKNNLFNDIDCMLNSNRGSVNELQNLWIVFWKRIKEYLESEFSILDFPIPNLPYIDRMVFEEMVNLRDLKELIDSDNSDENDEEKKKNEDLLSKTMEFIKKTKISEKGFKSAEIYLKRTSLEEQVNEIVNTNLKRIVSTISDSSQKQRKEFNEITIRNNKIADSKISKLEKSLEDLEKIDVVG